MGEYRASGERVQVARSASPSLRVAANGECRYFSEEDKFRRRGQVFSGVGLAVVARGQLSEPSDAREF